jgi:integrase/recombinase XerD
MLYALALYTGLRASELASLTPASFRLDADPPTVTVQAGYSKRRREDTVPLHPSLAERLRAWLPGRPTDGSLWAGRWAAHNEVGDMIRRDLENARTRWIREATNPAERTEWEASDFLTYRNSQGQTADFHALRHTFITNLVKAGVQPKDAKELARHSTITLTMDRYAHVGLKDSATAVNKLPALPSSGAATGAAEIDSGRGRSGTLENIDATGEPTVILSEPLETKDLKTIEDPRSELRRVPPAGFEPATLGLGNRCSIP